MAYKGVESCARGSGPAGDRFLPHQLSRKQSGQRNANTDQDTPSSHHRDSLDAHIHLHANPKAESNSNPDGDHYAHSYKDANA